MHHFFFIHVPKRFLIALFFVLSLSMAEVFAQLGGRSSFAFLDVPPNATISALGGVGVAAPLGAGFWQHNPALADSTAAHVLSLSYLPYYADIRQLQMGYVLPYKGGYVLGGVQYLNYGEIQGYDPSGAPEGTFTASDWSLSAGYAGSFGPYAAGAVLKWASSGIAAYSTSAILIDAGGRFRHPESDLTLGFLVRNLGVALGRFDAQAVDLPLDVQLGASFKPQFMPFRFFLQAHHLQRPLLEQGGNKESAALFSKVMRHVSLATALEISRNVHLRFGYNYLRRQELKLPQASGGAGFSAGLMIQSRRFRLDYSRAWYHAVGGRNQLSLSLNMKQLL